MTSLNKPVLKWTADHHTVISAEDSPGSGITRSQRRQLVDDEILERVLDGAYRFPGLPNDELARCVAACSRPGGLIIEGPTAGRLWGCRRMPRDGFVWVIAPPASNPSVEKWLRPYRTAMIDPLHVVHRSDGIRLTSPSRTVVDLARHLPDHDLLSVIDQVESEGMGQLRRCGKWPLIWRRPGDRGPGAACGSSNNARNTVFPSRTGSLVSLRR